MKVIIFLVLLSFVSYNGFSQVKFNVRLSPGISMARMQNKFDHYNSDISIGASNNGNKVSFSGGVGVDFFVKKRFAIATGLNYLSTQLHVHYYYDDATATPNSGYYNLGKKLNYLQIPCTAKFFTNEINGRMQIYFQGGIMANMKIREQTSEGHGEGYYTSDFDADKHQKIISPIDAGLYLGTGLLYKINDHAIYFGVYYNRGLTNITNKIGAVRYPAYSRIRMDMVGIEVGFRL